MAIFDFKSRFGKKNAEPAAPATHPAIAQICKSFDEHDIKYSVDHSNGIWEISAGVSGESTNYKIKFVVKDGAKNDVSIRVFSLVRCPAERRVKMYKVINDLNCKYRFMKFCIDSDNDINLEADLPSCTTSIGQTCFEMFVRIMKMVDDTHPVIMREMWS